MENQVIQGQDSQQSSKNPPKTFRNKLILSILLLATLAGTLTFLFFFINLNKTPKTTGQPPTTEKAFKVEKFTSVEDFKDYLAKAETQVGSSFGGIAMMDTTFQALEMTPSMDAAIEGAPRVSETNVQVAGIDEPDIVKTDGASIFLSSQFGNISPTRGIPLPLIETDIISEQFLPPPTSTRSTKVISAFPPASLAEVGSIAKQGNLLLNNKVLIIFSANQIYGYDVANPKTPIEKWKVDIESNNQIVTSRLFRNKLYVITKTRINSQRPCPVPMLSGENAFSINCSDIYHPSRSIATDVTFAVLSIDPSTGTTSKSVAFTGSSNSSVIYMSENAIYVTYTYSEDISVFLYNFFLEKGADLISEAALAKLKNLQNYDISAQSKITEVGIILENYYNSLDTDERRRIENEMSNRMEDYAKEQARNLQKTGIIKIAISDFSIPASGEIPGQPLNQFSLDEYQNHLRVATTIGASLWGVGESANDVYILDANLNITGSVLDMGLTEQIYSARFIEDKGYVVTFRRIDPFYVLDLSNPKNPQLKGELKIPGYSSYLHPISKDKILGVGEESSKVKLSLFDVSSADNPQEISKYSLDEYWSEISSTHHAFLLDPNHNVFFIPGGQGGYIFGYKNDELKLVRVVADINARRAIYINDYMYIIGDDKIVVLNENDWTEVNSLDLTPS